MPYYQYLKNLSEDERLRTVDGLQRIRKQLENENFPHKKASKSLILGTWNLRNFDDGRFNYGFRSVESMYYIAEIISQFDVIAIQEICVDLKPLKYLLKILGGNYDYIVTDVSHSSLGGNKERLGFIYDKGKVKFTGVAGEVVLPDGLLISKAEQKGRQFSRTPFGVEFQCGWFKFYFSTVHIFFGSNDAKTPLYKRRVEEIDAIANYLANEDKNSETNHILVGDFNIEEVGSPTFNALENNGFTVIKNRIGSNRDMTKFYDQISFRSKRNELSLLEPERNDRVIQFFDSVYRDEDFLLYKPIIAKANKEKLKSYQEKLNAVLSEKDRAAIMKDIENMNGIINSDDQTLKKYYDEWRTFQMSDHLPLWVEIKIDFSDEYLNSLKTYKR